MLLVVDVGNTHTVCGIFAGDELRHHWRVVTEPERTADEFGLLLSNLFSLHVIKPEEITGMIISSVVPPMLQTLEEVAEVYFFIKPLVVGPGIKTGMPIFYDNPTEVGADRIVNAVAAYEEYHQALIVVDFGTATTFDYISPLTGEIMAGKAEWGSSPQLPRKLPPVLRMPMRWFVGRR